MIRDMTSLSSGIVPSREFYTGETGRWVLYVDTEERARSLREAPDATRFTVVESNGLTREVRVSECQIEVRTR